VYSETTTTKGRKTHVKGTSHMRDGQYQYKVEKYGHGTRKKYKEGPEKGKDKSHAKAVREHFGKGQSDTIKTKNVRSKLRYTAFIPARSLEVWREGATESSAGSGAKGNDLRTTQDEFDASDKWVRQNHKYYTHENIRTNIHTSADSGPSSEGCQVVPVGEDYEGLVGEVQDNNDDKTVMYTLIDASKVELTLEKSEEQAL
jgi:hypothetical protein